MSRTFKRKSMAYFGFHGSLSEFKDFIEAYNTHHKNMGYTYSWYDDLSERDLHHFHSYVRGYGPNKYFRKYTNRLDRSQLKKQLCKVNLEFDGSIYTNGRKKAGYWD